MRIGYGTTVTVPAQSERWFSEMRAGRCFMRGEVVAAAAAQFAEYQIFNPGASGRQIIVYGAMFSSNSSDQPQLRRFDTALGTLIGNGFNMLLGGAASVAEIRSAVPAAQDGTRMSILQVATNAPQTLAPVWIAELSPGQGLIMAAGTANTGVCTIFWWNEP